MSRGLAISLIVVAIIAVILSIVLIVHHDKVLEGSALLAFTGILGLLQMYMPDKAVVGTAEYLSDRPLISIEDIANDYTVTQKKLEEDIQDLKEDAELEELLMKIDDMVETQKNEGIEVTDTDILLQQANKLIKNYKAKLENEKIKS